MRLKKSYYKKIKAEFENFGIPYKEINYSILTKEAIDEMQETVFEMDINTLSSFKWCLVKLKNMFDPNNFSSKEMFGSTNVTMIIAGISCMLSLYTILNIGMESVIGKFVMLMLMTLIFVLAYWQTKTNNKFSYYINLYASFTTYEEIVLKEIHRREQKSEKERNNINGIRTLIRQMLNKT